MIKRIGRIFKTLVAMSLVVGLSAYVPEMKAKEIKASEVKQEVKSNKWSGTVSSVEPAYYDNAYHIYTGEELAWVAEQYAFRYIYQNKCYGETIILESDIDLDFKPWKSIGLGREFRGTFDGNGKTISNLYFDDYCGLFHYVKDANIKNITVKNVKVNENKVILFSGGGAIISNNISSGDMSNIFSNITIDQANISTTLSNKGCFGGIVGDARNGSATIINCVVKNSVFDIKNAEQVGGFLGNANYYDESEILNCASYNNEFIINNDTVRIGGLIGNLSSIPKLFNCHAQNTFKLNDNINLDNLNANLTIGGLFGSINYIAENCGNIYDNSTYDFPADSTITIGGIAGYMNGRSSDMKPINVFWNVEKTGKAIGEIVNAPSIINIIQKLDDEMKKSSFTSTLNQGISELDTGLFPESGTSDITQYAKWEQDSNGYPRLVARDASSLEISPVFNDNSQEIIYINEGESLQLNAVLQPYDALHALDTITWSVPTESGMTVSNKGVLDSGSAKAGTETNLTVTSAGISKSIKIQVVTANQITTLKINDPGTLETGLKYKLTATTNLGSYDQSQIEWFLEEEVNGEKQWVTSTDKATINSSTGELKALKRGKIIVVGRVKGTAIIDRLPIIINDGVWDGVSSSRPDYYDGSWHIQTPSELRWMAEIYNTTFADEEYYKEEIYDTYKAQNWVLEADLDMGGSEGTIWEPIGINGIGLEKVFEGNGHTISNIRTDGTHELNGLFGWINKGTVKNLIINNPIIENESDTSYSGGLAGQAQDAMIENVTIVHPQISSLGSVGGLIGYSQYNSVINQCSSQGGNVQGRIAGGLVGEAIAYNGKIMNSYSTSTVTGIIKRSVDINVGGLVGAVIPSPSSSLPSGNTNPFTIQNSYVQSKVISNGTGSDASIYTGGLIGSVNSYISLENNYVSVPITNQMDSMTPGGLIGYAENNSDFYVSIANNSWDEDQVFRKSNNSGVVSISSKQAVGTGYTSLTGTNKCSGSTMKSDGFLLSLNENKPDPAVQMNDWTKSTDTYPYFAYDDSFTIMLKEDNLQLRKSESKQIEPVMVPFISGKQITYEYTKISGHSTITVNNQGLVTVSDEALPYQTAVINMTAKENGEVIATENVYITVLEDEVLINSLMIDDPGYIEMGDTVKLTCTIEPETLTQSEVVWRVKEVNPFADVSKDGILTAKQAGTFTVTAQIQGIVAERIITIKSGDVWDGETISEPEIKGNEIYIRKASELAWVSRQLVEGKAYGFQDYIIYLMNDIDLNNKNWTPIGTVGAGARRFFQGAFDGNGHKIKNLSIFEESYAINEDGSIGAAFRHYGLFGYARDIKVKNLQIENYKIYTSNLLSAEYIGTLLGSSFGVDVEVSNVHLNNGLITGTKIMNFIGGITSFMTPISGSIDNCSVNNLNVNLPLEGDSGTLYLGGVVGYSQGQHDEGIRDVIITNTQVTNLSINVSGNSSFNVGGISGDALWAYIENCSAEGKIDVTTTKQSSDKLFPPAAVGGLIGHRNGDTKNCYAAVKTTVKYPDGVSANNGSLIGLRGGVTTLQNLFYDNEINSLNPLGNTDGLSSNDSNVVGMTTEQMQASAQSDISLVSQLNQWVQENNASGVYKTWTANKGYPVLAQTTETSIELMPKYVELYAGDEYQLEKRIYPIGSEDIQVKFTSNDERVKVNDRGRVIIDGDCTSSYTAVITMTPVSDQFEPQASIIVVKPRVTIEKIDLNLPSELLTNKTYQCQADIIPKNADISEIKWSLTHDYDGVISNTQFPASITSNGVLATGNLEDRITVRAEYVDDQTIFSETSIRIVKTLTGAWDGTTKTEITAIENVIHITTPAQLAYVAEQCSSGLSYEGISIYLDADLDMGNHPWLMIGRDNQPFKGKFYGNDHTISNLYLMKDDKAMAIGLFGAIEGAEIHDLNLNGVVSSDIGVDEIAEPIGCLVGKVIHSDIQSIIDDCHVENATITHSKLTNLMGGIGGLIGTIDGKIHIDRSSVSKSDIAGSNVERGGLVGTISSNAEHIAITNCYVKDIQNTITSLFNIIGVWDDAEGYISNCYASMGADFGSTLYLIGKTIGEKPHRIENCYLFAAYDLPTPLIRQNSCKNMQIYHSYYVNSDKSYASVSANAPIIDDTIKLPPNEMFYGIEKSNSMVNQLNDWVSKQSDPSLYMTWAVRTSTPELVNPSTISFDVNEYTLRTKDTLKLIPKVKGDYLNTSLYWTSTYPSVAAVDQQGNVKAGVPGYATITATTQDGQKAKVAIYVRAITSFVQLSLNDNPENEPLDVGDVTEVIADMQPADDSLTWSLTGDCIEMSLNEEDNKKVTIRAIKGGTATLRAETPSGIVGTLEVTVSSYPTSIQIKEGINEIGVDNKIDHLQLTILFTPDSTTNRKLTFESSNTNIATIDADGLITFQKESDGTNKLGETLITVTPQVNPKAPSGEQAKPVKIRIQVNDQVIPVEELVNIVTKDDQLIEKAVIRVGSELPLYVKYMPTTATSRDFTWSIVSGEENVTIENNILKGLKEGNAKIRVSINGLVDGLMQEISLEKEITIQAAEAADILFDQPSISLKPNQSIEVKATIYPSAASQAIQWQVKEDSKDILEIVEPKAKTNDPSTITIKASKDAVIGTSGTVIAISSENDSLQKELPVYIVKNSATSVNVSGMEANSPENRYKLKVGQSVEFNAVVNADDELATNQNVTWTSSANDIALVEITTGKVKALAKGKVELTVTSIDGNHTKTIYLEVLPADLKGITMDQPTLTMIKGTQRQLSVTANAGSELSEVVWTSSNEKVATVENGKVTALSKGTTTITATSGEFSTSCEVTVVNGDIKIETIKLTASREEAEAGQTILIHAAITPDDATQRELSWSSSDPSVASVLNEAGSVAAIEVHQGDGGPVVISARATDGSGISATITITPKPSTIVGMELDQSFIRLGAKDIKGVDLKTIFKPIGAQGEVTWELSRNDLISLTQTGPQTATIRPNADAVSASDAYTIVTVRSGDVSAQCVVLLSDVLTEQILVQPDKMEITVSETKEMDVHLEPANATSTSLTWRTIQGNEDTVLISGDARHASVTGLKPGKVIVQAENDEGILSNPILIVVNEATQKSLRVYGPNVLLLADETRSTSQLEALLIPSFTSETYTWESEDEAIAEVDDSGLVTAIGAGSTRIIVRDGSGHEGSIMIHVYEDEEAINNDESYIPCTSIEIINIPETLTVGDTYLLETDFNMEGDTPTRSDVSWTSSDEAIVSIDERTGLITAQAAGTVTITLTSNEGPTIVDSCEIKVAEKESIGKLSWRTEITQIVKGSQETLNVVSTITGAIEDLDVVWTSSDPSVLKVTMDPADASNATVEAIDSGAATIYCQIDGQTISQRIQVTETDDIPIKEINIQELGNADYLEMQIGDTQALTITVNEDATNQELTISSKNPEIVSWDVPECQALQEGIAVITIIPTDPNNKLTKTIFIRVVPQPEPELYLDKESLVMVKGETRTIRAFSNVDDSDASYTWSCGDPAVILSNESSSAVSITSDSLSEINTKIYVTMTIGDTELTKTSTLRIIPTLEGHASPESIVIVDQEGTNVSSIAMDLADKSLILKAKVTPSDALQIVNWTSSAPSIASIEGTGEAANVTPHQSGQVTITAETIDKNQTISITLIVTDKNDPKVKIERIGIEATVNELWIGESTSIRITMDPESESMNHLLTASKEGIVEITAKGNGSYEITALKEGYVEISAAAINDLTKKDKISFTVKKRPAEAVIFNSFTLWDSENKNQISIETKIDALSKTIVVMIPTLQSKRSLIAHYTLSGEGTVRIGDAVQENGVTVNDYDGAYTTYEIVGEENNVTHMNVLVTNETIPEKDGAITSFTLNGVEAKIDQVSKTIEVLIDKNADRKNLTASYSATDTLSIISADGILNQGSTIHYLPEQVITLIGKNGNAVLYDLSIDIGPEIKELVLKQDGKKVSGTIDQETDTITFNVQQGTFDITQPFSVSFTHTGLKESIGPKEVTFTDGKAEYALSYEKNEAYYTYHLVLNEIIPETPLSLTSFKIKDTEASIDDNIVEVSLPYGTDLSQALKVEYMSNRAADLFINGDQISSGSSYLFTANKIVSCTLKNDQKEIKFSLLVSVKNAEGSAECTGAVVIAGTERYEPMKYDSIYLYEVPYETDLTKLKVELTAEEGAVIMVNGSPYDAEAEIDGTNDIAVVVQKENKTDRTITLRVQKSKTPSQAAVITSFTLTQDGKDISKKAAVIEGNIIQVTVPFGTDLSNVDYEFTSEIEGLTLNVKGKPAAEGYDFSSGIQKLIAHKEGYADTEYTLIINVESSQATLNSMTLEGITVEPDARNRLSFKLPKGSDKTSLIPSFDLSDPNAKVLINKTAYVEGSTVDFTDIVMLDISLEGVNVTYIVNVSISKGPEFIGDLVISQTVGEESEEYKVKAQADNDKGVVEFIAEKGKFDMNQPFTISYKSTEGSSLYEGDEEIIDTINLDSIGKTFTLKDASEENPYVIKIIEKDSTNIEINKFDLINVGENKVTIEGRIDHERKKIYLDVIVDHTEDFSKLTLDIDAVADTILIGGAPLIGNTYTTDLSRTVKATFIKGKEVVTYDIVTTSVVEGPYVSVFEILDTKEGTLTGVIDNKNKVINVEAPMTISALDLRIVNVNVLTNNLTDDSLIQIDGDDYDSEYKEMYLQSLKTTITLRQGGRFVEYSIKIVRPLLEGDMDKDGYLTPQDVQMLNDKVNGRI